MHTQSERQRDRKIQNTHTERDGKIHYTAQTTTTTVHEKQNNGQAAKQTEQPILITSTSTVHLNYKKKNYLKTRNPPPFPTPLRVIWGTFLREDAQFINEQTIHQHGS